MTPENQTPPAPDPSPAMEGAIKLKKARLAALKKIVELVKR
jgi:hypothetical protein